VFSVEVPVGDEDLEDGRQADIVLEGLEQAGDSFVLRLFLNDPDADGDAEPAGHPGYAGSVHIYGYGGTLPDRAQSPATQMPMTRRRTATEAIRAAAHESKQMTVTLVPVAYGATEPDVRLENVHVSVLVH